MSLANHYVLISVASLGSYVAMCISVHYILIIVYYTYSNHKEIVVVLHAYSSVKQYIHNV